jgi:hypothetical protein
MNVLSSPIFEWFQQHALGFVPPDRCAAALKLLVGLLG